MARKKPDTKTKDQSIPELPPELANLIVCADSLGNRKQSWLWEGRILQGKINLIQGWKGSGKSTTTASVAYHVINGLKLPGNKSGGKKGGVCLWLTTEEDIEADVKPRWIAQGGSLKSLACFDPEKEKHLFPTLPGDVPKLVAMCRANNIRILVLDPYTSLGGGASDFNKEQPAREYMESLKYLCDKANLTVILIGHLRKGKSGGAIEAGIGSVAIVNVARSVLRADEHPTKEGTFILSVVACNAAKKAMPITYSMVGGEGESPRVEWGECEDISMDDIIAGSADIGQVDEAMDAKSLLIHLLKDGPKPAKDILKAAREAGVGERSLRTAKGILKVDSVRISIGSSGHGHSEWVMPEQVPPPGVAVSLQPCSVGTGNEEKTEKSK